MKTRSNFIFMATTMLAAGMPIAAHAQAGSPTPAEEASTSQNEIPDIVVTAQRRQESLQKVPISAAVVSRDALQQRNVSDIRDIAPSVPNLKIDTPFGNTNPKITLRGIGSGSFNQNTESTVALYLDELVLEPTSAKLGQLFDMDRVEVLRGPQGTLYGKNSTGGAINFITRKPDGRTELMGMATVAKFGEYDLQAAGEVPLAENWSVRIAGKRRYRNGYGQNLLTNDRIYDVDTAALRAGLRYQGDGVDLYLKAFGDQSREQGFYPKVGGVNFDGSPRADNSSPFTGYIPPADRDTVEVPGLYSRVDNRGVTLNASFELGALNLTSISGYLFSKAANSSDADSTPFVIAAADPFSSRAKEYSQELRLSSSGDRDFSWIMGATFFRRSLGIHNSYQILTLPTITDIEHERVTSMAGFADGTLKLTSSLNVTGGIRITTDRKRFERSAEFSFVGPFDIALRKNWTNASYRAVINYNVDPNTLLYASFNHGYRSGAFDTSLVSTTNQFQAVDPEFVDSYEGGIKASLLDRRVRLAADVFYMNFKDQQLLVVLPGSICCSLANAGKSKVYGFEFDLAAKLSPQFDLTASGSISSGEYKKFQSSGVDYSGKRLGNLPTHEFKIAAEYRIPAGDEMNVFIAPELVVVGRYRAQTVVDPYGLDIQRGYAMINAQIGLRNDTFSIFGFVKNATNRRVLNDFQNFSSFGFVQKFYSEPRTFGVTVRKTFK